MTGQEVATTGKRNALDLPDRGSLSDTMEVVRAIANTDFVPKTIRGNQATILACVLYGREIGLGPMESLSEVHMIDGRPSLSAKAKVKRARQIGHDIWGDVAGGIATVSGKRGDTGREMTVTFSMDDARKANLTAKDNWKKYEEDMLWARAVSRLCRRLFTEDGMLGALDPDEAELSPEERVAESLGALSVPETPLPDDDLVAAHVFPDVDVVEAVAVEDQGSFADALGDDGLPKRKGSR